MHTLSGWGRVRTPGLAGILELGPNSESRENKRSFPETWCASRPVSACRSGGGHLGKFVWGSNLALVFEAVQSRPMTTFPESCHYYPKQYFRSFSWRICLPDSPNWRYGQNYDVNKWQVWIREAFLGRISASPGGRGHRWMTLLAKYTKLIILCFHAKKLICVKNLKPKWAFCE